MGEFDQNIDDKRRLAVPSALREQIDPEEDGEGFFLVLGLERHLWLYPDNYYRRLTATMTKSPFPTRSTQKFGLLFAMARYLKPDKQGRIVLPEKSIQRATVDEQVTLVGHYDHVEIWPRLEWEKYVQEHLPSYSEALLELGEELPRQLPPPPM
ncbi:MAG: hypothetical protein HQ546_02320 [Planctomycetes bacterium]|nr:hypothetical protein [Planctomycetota bacterium]